VRRDAGERTGPPDCPQLGLEEVSRLVCEADRTDTEEGIGLGQKLEVGDRLFAAAVGPTILTAL